MPVREPAAYRGCRGPPLRAGSSLEADLAKPLLEVLRDVSLDPTERAAFTEDPSQYLAQHGYEDVPAEDLSEAFGLMHDTLPADTALALSQDPVFELPGEPLATDDAAEVGELAPFGEVNGDFDVTAEDLDAGEADATADAGDADEVGDVDDVDDTTLDDLGEGFEGSGPLDDDLGLGDLDDTGAGTASAAGDSGDDLGGDAGAGSVTEATDVVGDDLAFGLGSAGADVPDPGAPDASGTPDLTAGAGGDTAALDDLDDLDDLDGATLDDVGPLDLSAGGDLMLDGDPLDHDVDDDLDDGLGLGYDDTPGADLDDLGDDVGGVDDIGAF
jgi:hypothetical protein